MPAHARKMWAPLWKLLLPVLSGPGKYAAAAAAAAAALSPVRRDDVT